VSGLRRLVNSQELPNIYAGYSRGTKTCDCCGRQILRGAHAYEITFSALKFVLDCHCIGFWAGCDAQRDPRLRAPGTLIVCPRRNYGGALRISRRGPTTSERASSASVAESRLRHLSMSFLQGSGARLARPRERPRRVRERTRGDSSSTGHRWSDVSHAQLADLIATSLTPLDLGRKTLGGERA